MTEEAPSLTPLLQKKRVLVLAGAGGVGKTTLAAALALEGARLGKKTLCISIDPARRLATSLGLPSFPEESMRVSSEWLEKQGVAHSESLTLLMLDTKGTFDAIVEQRSRDAASRRRILDNKLYQHLSANLAGTQAYMAMEKVLELREDSENELIVLDTPPMTHALDFLEAPERLIDAIDSPALNAFLKAQALAGRFKLNFVGRGLAAVVGGVARITGTEFVEDSAELLRSLNTLFGGLRHRAGRVSRAFRAADTAYVVVSSPARSALSEAHYFSWRLREEGMKAEAIVINRVEPSVPELPSEAELEEEMERLGSLRAVTAKQVLEVAAEQRRISLCEQESLLELDELFPPEAIARRLHIPSLGGDVHGVGSLMRLARVLCPPSEGGPH